MLTTFLIRFMVAVLKRFFAFWRNCVLRCVWWTVSRKPRGPVTTPVCMIAWGIHQLRNCGFLRSVLAYPYAMIKLEVSSNGAIYCVIKLDDSELRLRLNYKQSWKTAAAVGIGGKGD